MTETIVPRGFQWSAVKAGIKASGRLDLAVATAPEGATAAAMFTTNQVAAAPILVGRRHLHSSGGLVSGLVINAGTANCAPGAPGLAAAEQSCAVLAQLLRCDPDQVLPSSTGIIGVPLPIDKLVSALPAAVDALGTSASHAEQFGHAILTTDTRVKLAHATVRDEYGHEARIFGCCKGAGMIGPQVQLSPGPSHATMLVYLFTDLAITATDARELLAPAVEDSFNSISVDGDTSTNDTVLLLNSGASGIRWSSASTTFQASWRAALHTVCDRLAHSIVDDGEGVTHVVTLEITGAPSAAEAKRLAKTIANSPLCKTAWSSADPNWGRILAAAGYAGVPFDPALVTIDIGGLPVFRHGTPAPDFDKPAVHRRMAEREYTIHMDFGGGNGACRFLTCDLTEEYVRINADYST